MRAAVLLEGATPLSVLDDVDVDKPAPGQVLVRVARCGICHSDVTIMSMPGAGPTPMILGHEAAGTVEAVGAGVRAVEPGDRVVLVAVPSCGRCYWCARAEFTLCITSRNLMAGSLPDGTIPHSRKGQPVYRGLNVGGFGEYAMMTENAVVKIGDDVPFELACLLGCAVQTGVGAVLNAAKVEEGATVLVVGLGGIGVSVVQGARIAGAARIIVSDPVDERRDAAARFGATDALDPRSDDVVAECVRLTGVGVDYAFDAAGSAAVLQAGFEAVRYGGTVVAVGAPAPDAALALPAVSLIMTEKKLTGCLYGSGTSHREVPRLLDLWRRGLLDLEGMVTARRPLEEINDGIADLNAGKGIRTVLSLGS